MNESNKLIDSSGRILKKLRLNLLDACNMRCLYCMPENQTFHPIKDLLKPKEIAGICENLIKFGIEEIRLTGGEPLLRADINEIVERLSNLELKKLALTTNAIHLKKHLDFFKNTKLKNINISLDSLRPASFEFITRTNTLPKVLDSIHTAKDMGFNIKINCVMLKNINFEEIEDFLEFAAEFDIEVRFLELMKVGIGQQYFDRHFVSADEAIERIGKSWKLEKVSMPLDSTSFNFLAKKEQHIAKLGFIASETKPFCGNCSRLRLSNKGTLRPCLMINEGPNIRDLVPEGYEYVLADLIEKKPHHRLEKTDFTMNEIGG